MWMGGPTRRRVFPSSGGWPEGCTDLADGTKGEGVVWPLRMFQEEGSSFVTSRCFQIGPRFMASYSATSPALLEAAALMYEGQYARLRDRRLSG